MIVELLLGIQEPPKQPLIEYLQPKPAITEQVEPPNDPNGCEPAMYWASESPYYCIPKTTTAKVALNTPRTARNESGSGWYDWGWCTYWVSTQRSVGQWSDARNWTWQAKRDGWATGSTPQVGAIGQKGNHVVYVTGVGDGTFSLSEMNYQGLGKISYRTVSSSGWSFIY